MRSLTEPWSTFSGMPRAYNITDRFHPEEDGAAPRVEQTVLQQHVEFFDYVSTWSKQLSGMWGMTTALQPACGPCMACKDLAHPASLGSAVCPRMLLAEQAVMLCADALS